MNMSTCIIIKIMGETQHNTTLRRVGETKVLRVNSLRLVRETYNRSPYATLHYLQFLRYSSSSSSSIPFFVLILIMYI